MIRVDGKELPWQEGMTVADALREYDAAQACPVVRLGDHYVSRPSFETTLIPDEAEIFLIPMIAGG